jgi:HlyD family secretion protein
LILSVVVQFWSHHDTQFAHLLRTAQLSFRDSLLLLAVSALPLVVLEVAKLAAPSVAKDGRKEARPMRRWAGSATAVVFAVTAAGGWYYWPRPGDAPTSFVTHAIERGTVLRVVTATGVVRPPPKVAILATATGAVQFRDCEIGAKVTKDLLCATIDHERRSLAANRERAGLEVAQARLKQYEAKLARAATALARARGSADRRIIEGTTGIYNRALARVRRRRDLVAQRETRLRATEADLKRAEVRAPENGIVVSRGVETGQKVEAGVSPIFSMANPAVAQIEVSTTRAEEVKIGDLASVDVEAAPRRSFDARVTQIERARNVIILSAPNAERAGEAGMTATARIEVDRRDDALRAPNAAVRYSRSRGASEIGVKGAESGATLLWVLRNGRPTPVAARLGLDDGTHTEIVTGALNAGDELIIDEKIDARRD